MAIFQSACVDPNKIMASGSAQVFPSEVVMTHSVHRETPIAGHADIYKEAVLADSLLQQELITTTERTTRWTQQ